MAAIVDQYSKEELEQIVAQSTSLKEVVLKLGYSTSSGNNQTVMSRLEQYNIDYSHFASPKTLTKRQVDNIFVENSTASQATLRRWYMKGEYTPYVCSICGQEPLWFGKELTLILDHINGKNHDDRIENLRWVCPNCNQQLDTTGYKQMRVELKEIVEKHFYCSECGNEITKDSQSGLCVSCMNLMTRVVQRPTRQELKKLVRTLPFTQIGKQFGVSDNAIRKWCIAENIPSRVKEIKQISDTEWEQL